MQVIRDDIQFVLDTGEYEINPVTGLSQNDVKVALESVLLNLHNTGPAANVRWKCIPNR